MIRLMDMALVVFTMVMGMHEILIGRVAMVGVLSGLVGGKGKKMNKLWKLALLCLVMVLSSSVGVFAAEKDGGVPSADMSLNAFGVGDVIAQDGQSSNAIILTSKSATARFSCIANGGKTNSEVAVDVTGNYQYNESDAVVKYMSRPTVRLVSYSHTEYGPCYITPKGWRTDYTDGDSTATFVIDFEIYRDCIWGQDDCGTFEATVVGDGNGFCSCSPSDGYIYPQ